MDSSNSRQTYRSPALRGPELQDLRDLNKELKLMCTDHELQEMAGVLQGMTESYQRVSEMVDTSVPLVKYPRTPGYRPQPHDNPYNAWAWCCDIAGAASGKLAGKTLAIKDNTAVAGMPMCNGTKIMTNYVPEFDATIVTRILEQGGRILGKSAVENMCCSGSSVTSDDGPVRNPVDETRVAGGSSSGSAALVCAGLVDMATGGDQGGSIRIPASFTGIVGMKPTWGLVPYTGATNLEPNLDHLGPMTRTVADCALLLEVIAGYDEGRDSRQSRGMVVPEYSKLIDNGVKGKTIGLLTEGFEVCSEEAVKTVVREAAQSLTQAGCIVKEISVPMHNDANAIYGVLRHGVTKCLLDGCGTGYFMKGFYSTSLQEALHRGISGTPQDFHPLVKCGFLTSSYIDRHYKNRFYGKGQNLALELCRRYDAALDEVDVLIMPTLPHTAPKIPPHDVSFAELFKHCYGNNVNAKPFNLTGHPALSINAGFSPPDPAHDKGPLPIGMMIVGKKFDEVTVLQMARAFEKLSSE